MKLICSQQLHVLGVLINQEYYMNLSYFRRFSINRFCCSSLIGLFKVSNIKLATTMARVKPHTKHLVFKDNLIEFPFQQHILSDAGRRTPEEIYLRLLDV